MPSDFSLFNTVLIWIYNLLTVCIPVFLLVGVLQLVVATVFWRSEKRTRRLKRAAVLLLIAVLVPLGQFVLWRGVIRPSLGAELTAKSELAREARDAGSSYLRIGAKVPELDKLLADAGMPRDTPKIVVLNFFATWCTPCLAELPHLQRLADKYADREDVLFVVVGREESQETVEAFAAENSYRMQFVADPDGKVYSEFAKEHIPRTYLIDGQRKIRFEILGFDQKKLEVLDVKLNELASE